ncbi:MAG: hypothetical protein H0W50_08235 [Parachlamydiaceae bacterium]|nr:hypothetical protein [Parachlamydiaceae bacterium]
MSITGAGGFSPNIGNHDRVDPNKENKTAGSKSENNSKELKGVKPKEHIESSAKKEVKPHLDAKKIEKATKDVREFKSLKKTESSVEKNESFSKLFPQVPSHKVVAPKQEKDDFADMFPKVPSHKPKAKVATALTTDNKEVEKHIPTKKNPIQKK